MKFTYTRGFPIDEFNFNINSDGLPYIVGESQPFSTQFPTIQPNTSFDSQGSHEEETPF